MGRLDEKLERLLAKSRTAVSFHCVFGQSQIETVSSAKKSRRTGKRGARCRGSVVNQNLIENGQTDD